MDQLTLMNTFVRVAERGSFSAVARELNTSQPVISRQIAALEDQLGVRLIQRTTRRLALTEDGQIFLENARVAIEAIEAATASVTRARSSPAGTVRVGLPTALGMYLAGRLPEFFEHYPELCLDVRMRDGPFDLVEEGLDLVISIIEATQASVVTRVIGTSASMLVAAPQYLARHGQPAHPRELVEHECIVYSRPGSDRDWRFNCPVDGPDGAVTITVRGKFHVDNSEAVRRAARAGLGIALLPRLTIFDDVAAGRLVPVLDRYEPERLKVHAILPSRRHVAPRTRAIMDFIATEMETRPFLRAEVPIPQIAGASASN
jgi:DNA-binding transcriptional LysR family regulator